LKAIEVAASKESIMVAGEKSLHWVVDKWLAPTAAMPARVTQFCRSGRQRCCYVCVEASGPRGLLSIFFFRHDDGTWNVFPPTAERPSMNGHRLAAMATSLPV